MIKPGEIGQIVAQVEIARIGHDRVHPPVIGLDDRPIVEHQVEIGVVDLVVGSGAHDRRERARFGGQPVIAHQRLPRYRIGIERERIGQRQIVGALELIDEFILRHREIESGEGDEPPGRVAVPYSGGSQGVVRQVGTVVPHHVPHEFGLAAFVGVIQAVQIIDDRGHFFTVQGDARAITVAAEVDRVIGGDRNFVFVVGPRPAGRHVLEDFVVEFHPVVNAHGFGAILGLAIDRARQPRRGVQAAVEEEIAAVGCHPVRVLEMRVDADADALLIRRRARIADFQCRIMGVFFPTHAVQIKHRVAAGFPANVGAEAGLFEDLRDGANFCIIGVERGIGVRLASNGGWKGRKATGEGDQEKERLRFRRQAAVVFLRAGH